MMIMADDDFQNNTANIMMNLTDVAITCSVVERYHVWDEAITLVRLCWTWSKLDVYFIAVLLSLEELKKEPLTSNTSSCDCNLDVLLCVCFMVLNLGGFCFYFISVLLFWKFSFCPPKPPQSGSDWHLNTYPVKSRQMGSTGGWQQQESWQSLAVQKATAQTWQSSFIGAMVRRP